MFAYLSLGFLIGVTHAFEADHIAAVSSLVSGKSKPRAMIRYGAFWGLGHTLSLLAVGSFVKRGAIIENGKLSCAKDNLELKIDLTPQPERGNFPLQVDNKMKDMRRLTTRYKKLKRNFLSMLHLFAIRCWLN